MKKNLLLAISMLLCSCCVPITTVQDIEKKKASEDFVGVSYEYNWSQVYDAIMFVWKHSEVSPISNGYQESDTDYALDERAIWVRLRGDSSIDVAIFFEPRGDSRTYVQFVEGDTPYYWRSKAIQDMIDESKFYLKNGEKAYRKYTHEKQEALKKQSPWW